MTESEWVGTADAAAILGWSKAKVKRHALAGRLPYAAKLPTVTGGYLFDRAVIETLAAQEAA